MKLQASLFLAFLCVGSAMAAQVGHWGFDEGAGTLIGDQSALGNGGTLINPHDDTWVPGVLGGALRFPGVTGDASTRVVIPNNASLQMTGPISFAAWVYCTDLGLDAPVLAKEGPNGQNSYWFGVYGPSGRGHWGTLLDHDGYWAWDMNGRDIGNLPEGQWIHIAVTYDGIWTQHYMNGVSFANLPWQSSLFVGNSDVCIGVNSNFNYTAFIGAVDEVHLYNTAITPSEVEGLASLRAITGSVLLDDWVAAHKGCQVTVEVATGGLTVESTTTTLGTGGMYSVPTSLTGSYDVLVKGPHWLRKMIPNVSLFRVVSNLNFELINGDVDDDNEIGPGDFGMLSAAFGSVPGDGNWLDQADLDGDGEVGPSDFGVLSANFGLSGD